MSWLAARLAARKPFQRLSHGRGGTHATRVSVR
jgi:hypothetical protein